MNYVELTVTEASQFLQGAYCRVALQYITSSSLGHSRPPRWAQQIGSWTAPKFFSTSGLPRPVVVPGMVGQPSFNPWHIQPNVWFSCSNWLAQFWGKPRQARDTHTLVTHFVAHVHTKLTYNTSILVSEPLCLHVSTLCAPIDKHQSQASHHRDSREPGHPQSFEPTVASLPRGTPSGTPMRPHGPTLGARCAASSCFRVRSSC